VISDLDETYQFGKSATKQKNKEIKRSKFQILVGKKRSHFATAGALIASISMIAFSGNTNSQDLAEPIQQFSQRDTFYLGYDMRESYL
jgi:hypothetical protein